jgi:hypothetical protein
VSTLSFQSARSRSARQRNRTPASFPLRLRVLLRRARLDALLIDGADPVAAPELTLRAYQLTRPSHRRQMAAGIDDALATAASRKRRSPSAAPLAREGIAAARPELAELSRRLREEPVAVARGVALARRLLTDGAGPLYVDSGNGALRRAAAEAITALVHPV